MVDDHPARNGRSRPRSTWIIVGAVAAGIVIAAVIASVITQGSTPSTPPSAGIDGSSSPSPTLSSETPDASADPGADPADPSTAPSATPVPIGTDGEIQPGVSAVITGIESVEGVAQGPGEVGGPSVRFTVTVSNATATPVSLATTVINVDYGDDRTPAGELGNPGGMPFPPEVAAGSSATGTFIYLIPTDRRDQVRIIVDFSIDVPPVTFLGPVPA